MLYRFIVCVFLCLCTETIVFSGSLVASSKESQQMALEYYQRAVKLFETQDFWRAAEECQEATRIRRSFTEAYDLWGAALLRLGYLEGAEARFKEALKHNPKHLQSRGHLSFTYYRQKKHELAAREARAVLVVNPNDPLANLVAGLAAYIERDTQEAIRNLRRAEPLVDRNPEALFALARMYLYRHERAIGQKFVRKLAALPNRSKTDHFELGRLYDEYGLHQEAAEIFNELIQQFPRSYEAKYNLSLAYFHQEKIQEASELLQQLVVRHSRPEAHDLLAACYEELNETGKASRAYEKAIELDPTNEDYYLRWGQLAMNLMAYEVGIKNLLVAMQRLPNSYRIRLLLGRFYESHGESSEAEKSFREAISLDSHYALSWALLAMFFHHRGKDPKALQTIQAAISENPKAYLLPYVNALILTRSPEKGERLTEKIEALLKRSITMNPNFIQSRYLLGRMYLDKGEVQASGRELEKAQELNPSHYGTNRLLFRVYRELGETQRVTEVMQHLKQGKKRKTRFSSRRKPPLDESILFPEIENP